MLHTLDDAQALTSLLSYSPWNLDVGREVVDALGALGARAVPALSAALGRRGGNRIPRMTAAWLLGRLGGDRAVSALCAASQDTDREVAGAADSALARLGRPACGQAVAAA